jgi:hypothetical protein
MSPYQSFAVEMAALDLVHAIKCQRDCEPMDEKALLATLQDLRDAFLTVGDISDRIDRIIETLDEEQTA